MAVAKIISRDTVRHPYLIVWVGALLLLAVVQLSSVEDKVAFFKGIAFFAVLLSLWIKINDWEWNVVDEVVDCGDYLVVKYHGEEEIVPISNITNVLFENNEPGSLAPATAGPSRITLSLASPGKFGKTITFSPRYTRFFCDDYDPNKVADDLEARVSESRSHRAT